MKKAVMPCVDNVVRDLSLLPADNISGNCKVEKTDAQADQGLYVFIWHKDAISHVTLLYILLSFNTFVFQSIQPLA